MSMKKKYHGLVIPMITPVTSKGSLDKNAVEKIFELFYQHQAAPFILGTTGESSSVSPEVKKKFIKRAGKLKKNGTMLYAGISSNCLDESTEMARFSFDQGVDVVVATLPSYYTLSEQEMRSYFESLANSIKGPLVIYNIPATTHMSIPLSVIDHLSVHENIVGIKDSERSEERLAESLRLWTGREDFSHFLGWAARSADALQAGSDGLVPSTGNLFPSVYRHMAESVNIGDLDKAYQCQKLSDRLGALYQQGRTLGQSLWALKRLMQEEKLCKAHVLPPLQEGSERDAEELITELKTIMQNEMNFIN
jgi:dihydrodipicolinate synthase/N-acetylneuraminate lyase